MKMKKAVGHVVFTPLSYVFTMIEKGGSSVQQYDSLVSEFQPDRSITPYILQPCLVLKDADGVLQEGDVSAFMSNAVWTVVKTDSEGNNTVVTAASNTYMVDSVNGYKLTVYLNCALTEKVSLEFNADYYDSRRGDTQHFRWEGELTSQVQNQFNFNLTVDTDSKTLLSPFRNRGSISINARLMNGEDDVSTKATYKWYWFIKGAYVDLQTITDSSANVDYYPLWFDYYNGKQLVVVQSRIQDVIIKCEATIKSKTITKVFRLIRWYGQWEEHLDLLGGQFVMPGQTKMRADVSVSTRKNVYSDPVKYFDVEIFHSTDGVNWIGVSNESEYAMESANLMSEQHQFGCVVRELTAEIPLCLPNGSPLVTPDGKYVVVNVPEEK